MDRTKTSPLESVRIYCCHGCRGGGPGGGRRSLLKGRAGHAVEAFGSGCRSARGQSQRLALAVQALAADSVVPLPVLVLAEGAAVPGDVAAAARLTGFATTVPATLQDQRGHTSKRV